jgi:hypothetical protein
MEKWWGDLSLKQKMIYTAMFSTSAGATIGGVTSRRPLVGLGVGALVGFGLWGLAVTAYTAYKTQKAASKITSFVP